MNISLAGLPQDLLQDAATALDRYVRARRREKLLEEQAHLRRELRATQESRTEIQALFVSPITKEGGEHA